MVNDPATGALCPFDFEQIAKAVPEIREFGFSINSYTLPEIIDSSDLKPALWADLCQIILDKYDQYSGFVILHGTDTMAYSAAALSFMLNNLTKPVVFTGSQLPIGTIRTDGRENLIAALEIAAATIEGKAVVPEVCILFGAKLFRGNRTTKINAESFDAFQSFNYPPLAEIGIHIHYNYGAINYTPDRADLCVYGNEYQHRHIVIISRHSSGINRCRYSNSRSKRTDFGDLWLGERSDRPLFFRKN